MAEQRPDALGRLRDISTILLSWIAIIFTIVVLFQILIPAKKTVDHIESETRVKLEEALDGLIRIEKNIEAITGPERLDTGLVQPVERAALGLERSTANLADALGRLNRSMESVESAMASFKETSDNLSRATSSTLLQEKILDPVHDNLATLNLTLEGLRENTIRFQEVQADVRGALIPALEQATRSADVVSSSARQIARSVEPIAANLAQFTETRNLNSVFSLTEAARFISMPMSRSAIETDRPRVILQIDKLIDDDQQERGFVVSLNRKNINLDEFNSFQRVHIDDLSLIGKRGQLLEEHWNQVCAMSPASCKPEEMLQWSYSIIALRHLVRSGVNITDAGEDVYRRLPELENIEEVITPELVAAFERDPVLKNLKKIIVIRQARAGVKETSLPLSVMRVPLAPINLIRREIPLIP